MKKQKKKCKHPEKYVEEIDCPCPECGYVEGKCEKCGKDVCGNSGQDNFELN